MIYLVAFYSILSAVAVVVPLTHGKPVAAFCVALLCACAFIAGRTLHAGLIYGKPLERVLRCVIALLPLAVAYYLRHYAVNLVFYVLPGFAWMVIGAVIGFAETPNRR